MKKLFLTISILLICSTGWGAISVGNMASLGDNPESSTFSLNNNKSDVLVGIIFRDDTTFSGVTYGGVAMTEAASATDSVSVDCVIYYLDGAATGANDVVFTSDGDFWAWAIAVDGLDLSSIDSTNSATGTSTTPSVTLTTVATNTLIVDVIYHKNAGTLVQGESQTLIGRASIRSDSDEGGGSYDEVTSSGSNAMSWTIGASDGWLQLGVSFRAASATRRVIIIQ